eukprot:scaffold571575_cov19-Prasinocladus_malaysianus.AAC.1
MHQIYTLAASQCLYNLNSFEISPAYYASAVANYIIRVASAASHMRKWTIPRSSAMDDIALKAHFKVIKSIGNNLNTKKRLAD